MFNLLFKINKENETLNSLLLCPKCHNELLKIHSMAYDTLLNDYIINYKCSLKNEEAQNIYLKKYLITQNSSSNTSKDSPSYCIYHEYPFHN